MEKVRWKTTLVAVLALAPLIGYIAGAFGVPSALAREHPVLVWIVPVIFLLLALAAAATAYLTRRHAVDWRRVVGEQRLWESGPIGRGWLKRKGRITRRRCW